MIAVDTNILVYSHRRDAEQHQKAQELVGHLADGLAPWAIPWPCIHEFLANVTHPAIWKTQTPLEAALDQVQAWSDSPSVQFLCESRNHLAELAHLLREGRVTGARVHDARVAAVCLSHGVNELWSADRDFGRFRKLRTKNPLV